MAEVRAVTDQFGNVIRSRDQILHEAQIDSGIFVDTCKKLMADRGSFTSQDLTAKFPSLTDQDIQDLQREGVLIVKLPTDILSQIDALSKKHSVAAGNEYLKGDKTAMLEYRAEEDALFASKKFTLNPNL